MKFEDFLRENKHKPEFPSFYPKQFIELAEEWHSQELERRAPSVDNIEEVINSKSFCWDAEENISVNRQKATAIRALILERGKGVDR